MLHRSLRGTELAARAIGLMQMWSWVPISGVQGLIPKPTKGTTMQMGRAARELLRAVNRKGTDLPRLKPDKYFVAAFLEKTGSKAANAWTGR